MLGTCILIGLSFFMFLHFVDFAEDWFVDPFGFNKEN